jgi:hypothetical protein
MRMWSFAESVFPTDASISPNAARDVNSVCFQFTGNAGATNSRRGVRMTPSDAAATPESWSRRVADSPGVRLEIPADLARERTFEISIACCVCAVESAASPWHELRVFADGELQWRRRIATAQPAPYDGLDYRFRRTLAPGRRLLLLAESECSGARRLTLAIEAQEC